MTLTLPFAGPSDLAAATAAVREVLAGSGVVALPTDTFYGLAVDPFDRRAVDRIFTLKGRVADKALPVIVSGMVQVEDVAVLSSVQREALAAVWPAPVTVVLRARPGAERSAGTIAVRIPSHALLRTLLARVGALTATSANRSGEAPCATARAVLDAVGDGVALLLDGGATAGGAPSTLLDWTGPRPLLLRPGAWPLPPSWR